MKDPKDKRMNNEEFFVIHMSGKEKYAAEIDYRNDCDEESPVEYTEEYDLDRHE